ncbi:MAG: tetratricopeptide repeat protein [Planctomycetes bacterium]|nr:tetratricopeptide repeat protein [Planctomycetota bacterium]MBM4056990.1 tetratricopeptide repeat protein [Planctomycetota bacterium]
MPAEAARPTPPAPPASATPRQILLRRAAGYLELGELLVEPDAETPAHARRLLERSLDELRQLPEEVRRGGLASLLAGEALRAMGRWEEALDPLERAATADSERMQAWLGLGWCLKRLGRLSDAIRALDAGLTAAPRQPILLYNLACYHSLAGDVPAAIDHLTRAIAIDARFRDLTGRERDFDPIRSDPRFVAATHLIV